MKIKFKRLSNTAQLPVYATPGAAGMDLFSSYDEDIVLQAGEAGVIPTGIAMQLPIGYEAQIRPRSGLAFKHAVLGFQGTLDSDYRGEIRVLLINHSKEPYLIKAGSRIAQLVVNAAVVRCKPEFVEDLDDTERGEGGFGSTGDGSLPERNDPFVKEEDDAHLKEWKKNVGYIPYHEKMGDDPVDQDAVKEALLNHAKGIR